MVPLYHSAAARGCEPNHKRRKRADSKPMTLCNACRPAQRFDKARGASGGAFAASFPIKKGDA
jgi:hypothetical protein